MCLPLPCFQRMEKTFKLRVSSRRICGFKLFKQPPPVCQTVCCSFKDKLLLEHKTLLSVNGISRNADRKLSELCCREAEGGKNINKQPSDHAAVTMSGNQAQSDEHAHMYVVVAPESLGGSVCGCV